MCDASNDENLLSMLGNGTTLRMGLSIGISVKAE